MPSSAARRPRARAATEPYNAPPVSGRNSSRRRLRPPGARPGPISAPTSDTARANPTPTRVFSDTTAGTLLFTTGSSDRSQRLNRRRSSQLQLAGQAIGSPASRPTYRCRDKARRRTHVCPGAGLQSDHRQLRRAGRQNFDQGHKLNSFGTLRGRFGTTITPEVIAYATGGLAVGSIRTTARLTGTGLDADGNPRRRWDQRRPAC